MLHGYDHTASTGDKVHGATHALNHFPWDHPIGEIALLIDFHCAQNAEINVAAADHGEGIGTGEVGRASDLADGFLAGIDQIGVFFSLERVRTDAKHAIFALQHNVHAGRDV